MMKITYFGLVRSIASWSKVARNIIYSLIKKGIDVNIYERKGFLYDKNFNLDYLDKLSFDKKFVGDFVLTFDHPKNYKYLPKNVKRIGFLVYEFTRLPDLWLDEINKSLDLVFVPSKFTYEVFLRSGVDEKKLRVLRYGIDPRFYYKGKEVKYVRRFLTISTPHKREGLDILLKSFYYAFKDVEDVELILKLSYSVNRSKPFEIKDFSKVIEEYKKLLGKKLLIIDSSLNEFEMGELYRNSDIYFSLSKAESFGLCFLEAIGCGRTNICLNYSGQSDFLNDKNSIFLKYKVVETSGDEYEKTDYKQYIALADIDDCVDKLRCVYKNGLNKLPVLDNPISYYFWDNVVDDLIKIIL